MYITCEGLDGSGTTTLVNALGEEFPNAQITKEPTDSKYGNLLRENLSNGMSDPIVNFYLFMADRRNHIKQLIQPAEKNGTLVISDRYADSTRAYQPVALAGESDEKPFDSPWEAKLFIEQTMAHWIYEPDVTFYIDISIDTALERSSGDEKYENREFLTQVKDNYDAIADSEERIVRIDGEQSKENVAKSAIARLNTVAADKL